MSEKTTKARILDRSRPYRTLFTNPEGARYEQDGELFSCGLVNIKDLEKVEHGKPTEPQIEGYDDIIAGAQATAAQIIADAEAKAKVMLADFTAKDTGGKAIPPEETKPPSNSGSDLNKVTPPVKQTGKLNNELAKEIRVRADGGAEVEALVKEYEVSENVINNVITGKTYADAGGPIKAA